MSRRALRDFYRLQGETGAEVEKKTETDVSVASLTDVDVQSLAERVNAAEGIVGLVKIHNQLAHEARELDSEQKALVYDNYRKLIRVSDTLAHLQDEGILSNADALETPIQTIADAIRALPDAHSDPARMQAAFVSRRQQYFEQFGPDALGA